ncbi:MAG TPA: translation initiation factor IF-3 [Patescibacteria group bacterium]|nr:translation initiation factor IF-3 [Patescibacteria group bacterium]
MIKRFKRTQNKFYRTNDRIQASELRVLDALGKQLGVMKRDEALERARKDGVDLVEIAPNAKPPVAKIIDFKKFLYQEEKKKREEKKNAKVSETKEVRLGPFMSDNDLQVMVRRSRDFLEAGNKVRLVVKFAGRQITHPEFGSQILDKVISSLSDTSKVEKEKRLEGKQMICIVSPDKKTKNNENKEIGQ